MALSGDTQLCQGVPRLTWGGMQCSRPESILRDVRLFPTPSGLVISGAEGTDPSLLQQRCPKQPPTCKSAPKPKRWKSCWKHTVPSDNLVPFTLYHLSRLFTQWFLNCCWTLYLHKYLSQ